MRITPISPVSTKAAGLPKWLLVLLISSILLTIWMALQEEPAEDDLVAEAVEKPTRDSRQVALKQNEVPVVSNQTVKPMIAESLQSNEQQLNSVFSDSLALAENSNGLRFAQNKAVDLFKVQSWEVIKKVKPGPPPPPMAPPAPFVYMGKLEDTPKGTQLFLLANNRVITVMTGEKIDAVWRLDAEDANSIRLTYLPLNLPQTLTKNAKQINAIPLNLPNLPNSNQADSVQPALVDNNL
jgi:hypothetical protein